MRKQEFFIYDGERREDDNAKDTTVIAGFRMAAIAFSSPELIGAQNESTIHEVDGTKHPAPRGGFFGRRGYEVANIDPSDNEPMLEVSPRMTREHVAELGEFLGKTLPATGLLAPGESGLFLHDYTDEQDTVTRIADPRPRPSIDDILADMELAPQRLKEETARLNSMAPALAAATQEFPAA